MKSHYSRFLNETLGRLTYETKNGFITYDILEPGIIHITDIYVVPEARTKNYATYLADIVVGLTNAKIVYGSIDTHINNPHESLLVLLAYGMKLSHIEDGLVFFKKEVK